MSSKPDILSQIDRQSGMTVPDNYFADFVKHMETSIPEKAPVIAPAPRTFWQQVRPYVYLAAMFAGIWCMLQMFNIMGERTASSIDANPVLAKALDNESFVNDYVISDINDFDLYDELYNQGVSVSELTALL